MLQRQPQRPRPRPREITIPEEEATRHRQQIQPQARPQQCLQLRVHLQHLLHHRQLLRQLQVNITFWRENSNSLDFCFYYSWFQFERENSNSCLPWELIFWISPIMARKFKFNFFRDFNFGVKIQIQDFIKFYFLDKNWNFTMVNYAALQQIHTGNLRNSVDCNHEGLKVPWESPKWKPNLNLEFSSLALFLLIACALLSKVWIAFSHATISQKNPLFGFHDRVIE